MNAKSVLHRTTAAFLITTAGICAAASPGPVPGSKLWQFTAGGEIRSSPAIAADGTIYFGARDNKLYALNPGGSEKWTLTTGGWLDASPAIGPDGTIYAGSQDGQLYAVSPAGKLLWSFPTSGVITQPPAVASDGTIYFTASDGQLYALASNGAKKWQFATGWDAAAPSVGSDGTIYAGQLTQANFSNTYYLAALNPDGTVRWKAKGSGAPASCAVDLDGTIYPGGGFYLVLRADGTVKDQSGAFSSSSFPVGSPVAIGLSGRVYIDGPFGGVFALTPDATRVWPPIASISSATPIAVAADGTVYVGDASGGLTGGKLHVLNGADGTENWSFQTSGEIYGAPTIGTNGVVYVGSTDDNLYALQGTAGPAPSGWPQYRHDARHTGSAAAPVYSNTQLGVGLYAGVIIPGNIGSTYRIEYTAILGDTNNWSFLGNVTLDRTPFLFFDVGSANSGARFYRAILVSP